MTICKFWRSGSCKFGNACKFEHPPGVGPHAQSQARQPPSQPAQNRFGLFDRVNNNQNYQSSNRSAPAGPTSRDPRDSTIKDSYGVTPATITEDLRERPLWMMSAYGPGRHPPTQLFGGPDLEQSPEEIRTLHYMALASGTPEQSGQIEAELAGRANQQLQMVMNEIQGALKYLREGEKQHPNRKDICQQGTTSKSPDGPFSYHNRRAALREQQKATQPSGFGAPPPAAPGFGTPPQAPSGPGQVSGFGQQGFGGGMHGGMAPPQVSQTPGFGQAPSGFGQSPSGGFGGVGSGFGSTSQQPQQPAFGQPQQPQQPAFGQPQQPQQAAFGQPQQSSQQPAFGAPATQGGGFGFPAQKENVPFGGAPAPSQGGFGGGLAQQPSGLGGFGQAQPQQQQQQSGGFFGGQQQSQSLQSMNDHWLSSNANTGSSGSQRPGPNNVTNGFSQPAAPQEAALPTAHGDLSTYSQSDASGRLIRWKGRAVQYDEMNRPCYVREDRSKERIWFPTGPPQMMKDNTMNDVDLPPDQKSNYIALKQNGSFVGGVVPELPPKLDMTRWDV